MPDTALRTLVDLRDRTLQKSRIAFSNRVAAIENGSDSPDPASLEINTRWLTRFAELEAELDRDITVLAKQYTIIDHMVAVRGVGYLLAAKTVAMIDIARADSVSALWRYAGYAVIDGQRERPVKGEKLHYNSRLKTTLYLVATSMLRSNSPYRRVYDDARQYYAANRPEWTPAHQHQAAMRKMTKIFLAHLWLRWRQLEQLPTRDPYILTIPPHSHMLTAEEFGWPSLDKPAPKAKQPARRIRPGMAISAPRTLPAPAA